MKSILVVPVPDGKPVIGPVPNFSNVLIATGHEGGGLSMVIIVLSCSFSLKVILDLSRFSFILCIEVVKLAVLFQL